MGVHCEEEEVAAVKLHHTWTLLQSNVLFGSGH
jgi:hypothetical protein